MGHTVPLYPYFYHLLPPIPSVVAKQKRFYNRETNSQALSPYTPYCFSSVKSPLFKPYWFSSVESLLFKPYWISSVKSLLFKSYCFSIVESLLFKPYCFSSVESLLFKPYCLIYNLILLNQLYLGCYYKSIVDFRQNKSYNYTKIDKKILKK